MPAPRLPAAWYPGADFFEQVLVITPESAEAPTLPESTVYVLSIQVERIP